MRGGGGVVAVEAVLVDRGLTKWRAGRRRREVRVSMVVVEVLGDLRGFNGGGKMSAGVSWILNVSLVQLPPYQKDTWQVPPQDTSRRIRNKTNKKK